MTENAELKELTRLTTEAIKTANYSQASDFTVIGAIVIALAKQGLLPREILEQARLGSSPSLSDGDRGQFRQIHEPRIDVLLQEFDKHVRR